MGESRIAGIFGHRQVIDTPILEAGIGDPLLFRGRFSVLYVTCPYVYANDFSGFNHIRQAKGNRTWATAAVQQAHATAQVR